MSHSRLGLADGWGLLQSMRFNQDRSAFVCAFQVTNKDDVSGKSAGCILWRTGGFSCSLKVPH